MNSVSSCSLYSWSSWISGKEICLRRVEGSLRRLYPLPSSDFLLRKSWILPNQSAHPCWYQSYWKPKRDKMFVCWLEMLNHHIYLCSTAEEIEICIFLAFRLILRGDKNLHLILHSLQLDWHLKRFVRLAISISQLSDQHQAQLLKRCFKNISRLRVLNQDASKTFLSWECYIQIRND